MFSYLGGFEPMTYRIIFKKYCSQNLYEIFNDLKIIDENNIVCIYEDLIRAHC